MPDTLVNTAAGAVRGRPFSGARVFLGRPSTHVAGLRSAILGDALFGTGSRRLAEAHIRLGRAATYTYEFAWQSTASDGQLGADHTVELPFVFDRLDLPALRGARGLLGPAEPSAALATRMHRSWVDFAHTGDPGWSPEQMRRFAE